MSAISQQDWQDQEDGRALRELREVPDLIAAEGTWHPLSRTWKVTAWVPSGGVDKYGPTIADAADACRAALRERA